MAVLGRLPLNLLFHVGVLLPTTTILLCYTLAASLGHVPAWLPMISDCAVFPPEKYPFRWGMVLSAALIGAQSVLVYGADKPYSKSKVALVLGVLASLCLSVIGVVNEEEDNTVHSGECLVLSPQSQLTVVARLAAAYRLMLTKLLFEADPVSRGV